MDNIIAISIDILSLIAILKLNNSKNNLSNIIKYLKDIPVLSPS
jgi:hypothetical protein